VTDLLLRQAQAGRGGALKAITITTVIGTDGIVVVRIDFRQWRNPAASWMAT
jgi:hypothetical protein